ncbi:hypothetical protein BWP24_12315 [Vibrio campbellii]|uniref:DEAD/DEAH box helicase family protein n=1 Tax=Vibrio campbellii TaxID=680 RepID=UPI000971802F|nr:DEAD/DEAH box helicase family protein [Vibrio campbellii]APX06910.1 hypothetical protein BWP24_12315 [Vibrio campbellii]ARR07119.1 Hef nuclease [Vibrio campbellii]
MLTELNLKQVYRTGEDSLLEDFYSPCLSASTSYDRAVGYFSSSLFQEALKGIGSFIRRDGKIRLIIGHPLSDDEFNIIKSAEDDKEVERYLIEKFDEIAFGLDDDASINRLDIFKFLVFTKKLEIKFALRRVGMYHEKIGCFRDKNGSEVVFQGSANETEFANSSHKNFESIMVFSNWNTPEHIYENYTRPFLEGFERIWRKDEPSIITLDLTSKLYARISEGCQNQSLESFQSEFDFEVEVEDSCPNIPLKLNGSSFKLKEHQLKAIESWSREGREPDCVRGVLKLATGAGKTITSICCAVRLYNMIRKKNGVFSFIISVPYDNLAEQWVGILKLFNFNPIKCYRSSARWIKELNIVNQQLLTGMLDNICLVVVNKTLTDARFQEYLTNLTSNTKMFFVGDECHHHSSMNILNSLPACQFRMGLSATPYYDDFSLIEYDDTKKEAITSYYGNIVSEYSLSDALSDNVLTPYNYYVHPVYFNEEESDEYIKLSKDIAKKFAIGETLDSENSSLSSLLSKRTRLMGNLSDKIRVLKNTLNLIDENDKKHTLVYCGDGSVETINETSIRQVDLVSQALHKSGWTAQKFTSSEGSLSRVRIMNAFRNEEIDSLIAIRVLDEGIDVPVCKTAIIMASSKNPRQYVQRRGRILRKAENKNHANIHDFLVIPSDEIIEAGYGKKLLLNEFARIMEFNSLAINSSVTKKNINVIIDDNRIDLEELEFLI